MFVNEYILTVCQSEAIVQKFLLSNTGFNNEISWQSRDELLYYN